MASAIWDRQEFPTQTNKTRMKGNKKRDFKIITYCIYNMERRFYVPFLVYFLIFGVLFLLHIFFAMYDAEFLFELVALTITISIFFMGPIILLISHEFDDFYDEKLFICLCFSPILGFGLG